MNPTELYWWLKLYWRQDGSDLKHLCWVSEKSAGRICWPATDPKEEQLQQQLQRVRAGSVSVAVLACALPFLEAAVFIGAY